MSVLIKGMKMPKNSLECEYCKSGYCNKMDGRFCPGAISRPDWCPLFEIQPHTRLVNADALGLTDIEIIMCDGDYKEALKMLIDKIEHASTIEPERNTGKWIQISPARIYECSLCHQNVMTDDIGCYKFCHNCGARMEGKE